MRSTKILLVGLGGFGKNHLAAWCAMGRAADLYVAEIDPAQHKLCEQYGIPPSRITTDHTKFLPEVDVVDVVVPSTAHYDVCSAALVAGRDVFVEKPMAMDPAASEKLAELARVHERILQVGYYYRYHPISRRLRAEIRSGSAGKVRYLDGKFLGFKRARTDVGVTHTDAVHWLDLMNWLVGGAPTRVQAVMRDHFGRGMEDLSIVLMEYPDGTLAKIESGYVQPGRWKDKVVPDAVTTKEIVVVGSERTFEADYETETLHIHNTHHEPRNGTWWPTMRGTTTPNVPPTSPNQMIQQELRAFLDAVATRQARGPGPIAAGVVSARLVEAIYRSAQTGLPQELRWTPEEIAAIFAEGPEEGSP